MDNINNIRNAFIAWIFNQAFERHWELYVYKVAKARNTMAPSFSNREASKNNVGVFIELVKEYGRLAIDLTSSDIGKYAISVLLS